MNPRYQYVPKLVRLETMVKGSKLVLIRYMDGPVEVYAPENGLEIFVGHARRGSSFECWAKDQLDQFGEQRGGYRGF